GVRDRAAAASEAGAGGGDPGGPYPRPAVERRLGGLPQALGPGGTASGRGGAAGGVPRILPGDAAPERGGAAAAAEGRGVSAGVGPGRVVLSLSASEGTKEMPTATECPSLALRLRI